MDELKNVKGIGPKALSLLEKIGIYTIEDLVTHYPFRYEYLRRDNLNEVLDKGHIIIDGKIESVPILMRFKAGLNKMNFRLVTQSGVVGVSIFNRAFMKKDLEIGIGVTVVGKYDKAKNVITAAEIKMGTLSNKVKIEPVYHATSGLTNKNLSTYINMALLMYGKQIRDYIPNKYIEKYGLSEYDAGVLSANRETSDYFEEVLSYGSDVELSVNFVTTAILSTIKKLEIDIKELFITPKMLSGVIDLVHKGDMSLDHGKKLLYKAIEEKTDPMEIVKRENLHQINDESELLTLISGLMDENPEQVRQYVEDDNKAIINFFIGQTMKRSNRQANPNKSLEIIKQELEKRKNNA